MKTSVLGTFSYKKVTILLMVMNLPGSSEPKGLQLFIC